MNTTQKTRLPAGLDSQIQQIIDIEDLGDQRDYLKALCEAMGYDFLDCAAALLYFLQNSVNPRDTTIAPAQIQRGRPLRQSSPHSIKMARYRLDVGRQHQVTVEELKKVLVEESGVDKNNITHVDIQDFYTLIELPDEMPPDIFLHLKTVEINQQKLDIRRVKNRRPKKYGKTRYGRHRQQIAKQPTEPAGFADKN
ncbi:MAG: DbpA RNA binding domain-containing protein [Methylomicrobium sp.]